MKKATWCTCLVSVALRSHLLPSQTCLQGDCCTFCKSHNLSFPFPEEFIQNRLLLHIISYFGFCFSNPCYLYPPPPPTLAQGSSLNKINRIFATASKITYFPPFRRRFPFKAITDVNCHLYVIPSLWRVLGGTGKH